MADNKQNGAQEAPDSIQLEVQFPTMQYGYLKVSARVRQDDNLQASIDGFMDEAIYHLSLRAAELGRAWAEATVQSMTGGEPPASGVPLPAGPAPAVQAGRMAQDKGELQWPPKVGDNMPGDTFQFVVTHYEYAGETIKLWQDGSEYAFGSPITPRSPAWPSEEWRNHMIADGKVQPFGKPVRAYCVVSDKPKSKNPNSYYVNVVRLEVAHD